MKKKKLKNKIAKLEFEKKCLKAKDEFRTNMDKHKDPICSMMFMVACASEIALAAKEYNRYRQNL